MSDTVRESLAVFLANLPDEIIAGAVAAEFEKKLDRELTDVEKRWLIDGWMPATLKVDLR